MPNFLMLSIDDLNDWTSPLGGYGGVVHTPNIQRIADQGVSFANAFTTAPTCNMSRASTLSGMSPLTTGVLTQDQLMFEFVDPAMTIPAVLRANGYVTATAGKVFHELPPDVAARLYDHVLTDEYTLNAGDKVPRNVEPTTTTQPVGYYTADPATLSDAIVTSEVAEFLAGYTPDAAAKGLFLSVGLARPHAPWFVPKEYFDLYPLDQIVLPETLPDDLADIPAFGQAFTSPAIVDRTILAGEYAKYVQGYLAAISFADAMVGRLLDAVAASAIGSDTIVVLWSDHGYGLGEKSNFGKGTLWDDAARAQFTVYDPNAAATAGQVKQEVVSLLDLFPTVMDYAGIDGLAWPEGTSLKDFIQGGDGAERPGYAVTLIQGSYSIRTDEHRYIRYADGSEELYDIARDPELFVNRAADGLLAAVKADLAGMLDAYLSGMVVQNTTATPTRLEALQGERVLIAGAGGDTLVGNTDDNVYLVRTAETVIVEAPGGGIDLVITQGDYTLPDNVENLNSGSADETDAPVGRIIRTVNGNASDNIINIFRLSAIVDAGAGNDSVFGGRTADVISGGAGQDTLLGNVGADTLDGGAGDDILLGGLGDDVYMVSSGSDQIRDRMDGGIDRLDISAWGQAATVVRFPPNRDGIVTAMVITDTVSGASVTVDMFGGRPVVELLVDHGAERLLMAGGWTGTVGHDIGIGSAGADTLAGLAGDDRLSGAAGNDTMEGGAGNDLLQGGVGDDLLDGGEGSDTASYSSASAGVAVSLQTLPAQATGGGGVDGLVSIEHLIGSAFADALTGADGSDNSLQGRGGGDTLAGGGGKDRLTGGTGQDLLSGGIARDWFIFDTIRDSGTTDATADRIADFTEGDKIVLTALDALETSVGDAAFVFIGTAAFSAAGQARYRHTDGNTYIEVTTNGDVVAEMVIRLDGLLTLTASSFLL